MRTLDREKLQKVLDAWMEEEFSARRFAGAEVMVLQGGKTLYRRALGYKNYLRGEMLSGGEIYRLASMTKPVTAAASLIAQEQGLFSLDDLVKDHFPAYADMDVAVLDEDGKPVVDHKAKTDLKLWQLLSHVSGILAENETGNALFEAVPASAFASCRAMADYSATQPLAFEPGEATYYTGSASFDVLASLIEEKSGLRYSEFLRKYLFGPLGITDVTYHPTEEQWQRFISLHDRSDDKSLMVVDAGKHIYETQSLDYECAGGGLAGSIADYAKFAQMLCNEGELDGVRVLSPESVREMRTPRVPDGIPGREPNDSWGLGVRVKVHADHLPEGVFGWSGAYGTHFFIDPADGITALLLRNMRFYDTCGCGKMGVRFEKAVMRCAEQG